MLTSIMRSHSSTFNSSSNESGIRPALLTRTSSRPNRSCARLMNAATSSRLVTSSRSGSAAPPAFSSSAASVLSLSSRRAPSTTLAPCAARWRAVASPIPLLAPVIATTLPISSDIASLLWQQACPAERSRSYSGNPPARDTSTDQASRRCDIGGRRGDCRFGRLVQFLRPRAVVRKTGHQRDSNDAHQHLHPDGVRNFNENDVGCAGQEDAVAEHLEGLLPAKNHRPKERSIESGPIARHVPDDEERDDQEMNDAGRVEVGLVVRNKRDIEPMRQDALQV